MTALQVANLPQVVSLPAAAEVLSGLTGRPKRLAPWLFYDAEGSRLFEQITELPEYYLTRTERGILAQYADEMIACAAGGRRLSVLELGAGTATKTGLLLKAAVDLQTSVVYRAIDVSEAALSEAKTRLEKEIPGVTVRLQVADYTRGLSAADLGSAHERRLVLYVGSSIGNFEPAEALDLLKKLHAQLAPGDAILLGVDRVKERWRMMDAYNDAAGVTAAFNRNILVRINRELGANFDPLLFCHNAIWNPRLSRMEMHLRSARAQDVAIGALGLNIHFAAGETIHTENSYKFAHESAAALLEQAGFDNRRQWTDSRSWFEVFLAFAH